MPFPKTPDFRFSVGDIVCVKEAVQCDFRSPIGQGRYQLMDIFPHPKTTLDNAGKLESFCYRFSKLTKDGKIRKSSGFIYNCLQWDRISIEGKVLATFKKDEFVKELRDLLLKFQVSLSAGSTYDSPWDESESPYPTLIVNLLDGKEEELGASISPWSHWTP